MSINRRGWIGRCIGAAVSVCIPSLRKIAAANSHIVVVPDDLMKSESTEHRLVELNNGVMSIKTWSHRIGIDWEVEHATIFRDASSIIEAASSVRIVNTVAQGRTYRPGPIGS